ncbi:TadE/TadG family type IV pilus assembly protein [Ruegeria arenilitoris]|uniref:TadE/TadG family type IV pilus assembly protein n=1 Tax=Ruegeria arenilitoris TaxID=1173585 RepID=UPI001480FEFA|nr:hypothetical protein [Ruegeria arenilitoris]
MKRAIASFLKQFFDREDGIITVEAVLVLPMMFWSIFASYTYYDSYRQSARNIKAAYTVADIISRERNMINATYINTMHSLLETMVSTRAPVSMRISFLLYEEPTDGHTVLWSCVRGGVYNSLNDGDAKLMKPLLPTMPDNGKMIVVETNNTYRAPFNIGFGFDDFSMGNFVFTHPRVFDNIVASTPC